MGASKTVYGNPILDMSTYTGEIYWVNGVPHEKLDLIEYHENDKAAYDNSNTVWKFKPVTNELPEHIEDKNGVEVKYGD